jgi:hypothetical protein
MVTREPTPDPFDRSLPSPIAAVLELRASARDSVIVADDLTALQKRMLVPTGLEKKIVAEAEAADALALIVIGGSAGGGKSAAISRLAAEQSEAFAGVLEDATHAEAPDQEQYDTLVRFLAPLADDSPAYAGKPLLIAMNTGMAIRFFDQLGEREGREHRFSALESELRRQLDLPESEPRAMLPGRVLVVNLDLRMTAGGDDSLFHRMLAMLEPDRAGGVMDGAPRCVTCRVRDFCFVRTNAEIVSAEPAAGTLDRAAEELALLRGRPLQPRALWDLAADVVTGGERFDGAADPCDLIAELAGDEDRVTVWRRLALNGAFVDPHSELGAELAQLDPSYFPGDLVHDLMTAAGIDPAHDAAELRRHLGAEDAREAVETAAAAVAGGEVVSGDTYDRAYVGRGLVRAAALVGQVALTASGDELFRAALADYEAAELANQDNLNALEGRMAIALARAFGVDAGLESFFYTRAYDPRRTHAVLVEANLLDGELLKLCFPDPVRAANLDGARIAGYRPLAIVFELAGVELRVDLPLFRLLDVTAAGTKPSSADLERFFALRRAAESLGRTAAADERRPLLIAERDSGRRYRLGHRRDVLGNSVLAVQEVVR